MLMSESLQGFKITRLGQGYSQATVDLYMWALSILCDYLGDPQVEQITGEDLLRFFVHLRTEYKPRYTEQLAGNSLENVHKEIRCYWSWLGGSRPDTELPRPRHGDPEVLPYSLEEVKALLQASEYTR